MKKEFFSVTVWSGGGVLLFLGCVLNCLAWWICHGSSWRGGYSLLGLPLNVVVLLACRSMYGVGISGVEIKSLGHADFDKSERKRMSM